MADSITTIITSVQQRFPDMTTARGVQLANLVHSDVLNRNPSLRRVLLSISLTAGTREYAISEFVAQVDQALYRTDANTAVRLGETSIETLNRIKPNWRADAQAVPQQAYVSNSVISTVNTQVVGLYPTPSVSTNTGFPILELWATQRDTSALVGGSLIPQGLPSSQVYVDGISYYASIELRPTAAVAFKQVYDDQMANVKEFLNTKLEGNKDTQVKNKRV